MSHMCPPDVFHISLYSQCAGLICLGTYLAIIGEVYSAVDCIVVFIRKNVRSVEIWHVASSKYIYNVAAIFVSDLSNVCICV